jgi:chromate transporter
VIHLELFWTFFKLGLFSFGGGYAMIPMMQQEILAYGWIGAAEFADMVAVSQMTPGPIAVNLATYVGWRTAGVGGSAVATIGVFLPSLILCLIAARLLARFRENRWVDAVMGGLRPAIVGLIASAVVLFAGLSLFHGTPSLAALLGDPAAAPFAVSPGGLAIFALILLAHGRFRLDPLIAVLGAGVLGVLLC